MSKRKEPSISFAVVREDPIIESHLVADLGLKNLLLVASGGCTALSLNARHPDISITLFDMNQAQLELVREKSRRLGASIDHLDFSDWNIETDNPKGLNTGGKFEKLFQSFRSFIHTFIITDKVLTKLFDDSDRAPLQSMLKSPYWPVAFDLYFSDSLLLTMFGPDAVQHADSGSYPRYFQKVFEEGFAGDNFADNPYLQHVFLGYYKQRKSCWPWYLQKPTPSNFTYIHSDISRIDLKTYDLISLSNIFDWMSLSESTQILDKIAANAKPGTYVLIRQLNNTYDYAKGHASFHHHKHVAQALHTQDKSLFYNKLTILQTKGV